MFKNYFKITLRNIKRHKLFSYINISGLAVGMACVIIIMLWVQYEMSFDKYHEKAERVFRVANESHAFPLPRKIVVSPPPMSPALVQEFPEIEASTRISRGGGKKLFSYGDKHFFESYYAVDPSFFNIFTVDFLDGNGTTALDNPYSIVLSEEMAGKYFGNEDPVGKIIHFDQKTDFTVTGVIKKIPSNSHLKTDIFIPFETWGKIYNEPLDEWMYLSFYTYILLRPNVDPTEIEPKFIAFTERHGLPKAKLFLQSLPSIHLQSHYSGEISQNTRVSTLLLFGAIAVLILIIACINFMNLTTARSSVRLKEVGMRKVIGAKKSQIVRQFLGESLMLSIFSLVLALVLASLFLPFFNSLSERNLSLNVKSLIQIFPWLFALVLFTGLFAGSYPSFLLSSFKPITVLRGGSGRGKGSQKTRLRNILVVVQFSVSLILIIATLLVRSQLDYVRNRDMGFDKNQIVVVTLREASVRNNVGPILDELKKNPRILYASSSMHAINDVDASTIATWPGKPEDLKIWIKVSEVGYDYTDLYGIKIVKGRSFSREFLSDEKGAFLVNETAVKALGQDFQLGMELHHWRNTRGKVVGVMKDFHLNSLHEEIQPLYYYLNPNQGRHVSMKIQGGNIPETIGFIQKTIKKFSPLYPFEYHFFDDLFNMAYINEQKMERIFAIFSFIAIFVACMGVFGLSSFIADQKRKEIGIRKVLGAPVSKIIYLLSRDMVRPVLFANFLGWPVAYYVMNRWLQNFAYHTNISLGFFILSALLTFMVSFGTLSYQAIKAALSNPVNSLRYE